MEESEGTSCEKKKNVAKIMYRTNQTVSCSCNIKMPYNVESWWSRFIGSIENLAINPIKSGLRF